jgi:hypothetical protein
VQAHYDLSDDFFRLFLDRARPTAAPTSKREDMMLLPDRLRATGFHDVDVVCATAGNAGVPSRHRTQTPIVSTEPSFFPTSSRTGSGR